MVSETARLRWFRILRERNKANCRIAAVDCRRADLHL